jgi:hypothetical protein
MKNTTEIKSVEQRIEDAHGGIIGVMTGLMMLRQKLGDKGVKMFLDTVPERGEALWVKFREARDRGEAEGFVQFAAKAIVPKSMGK